MPILVQNYLYLNIVAESAPSVKDTEVLQKAAIEVAETIKGRIGDEEFTKRVTECKKLFASRVEGRKRKQKVDWLLEKQILFIL